MLLARWLGGIALCQQRTTTITAQTPETQIDGYMQQIKFQLLVKTEPPLSCGMHLVRLL